MSYIADRVSAVIAEHGKAMLLKRTGVADLPLAGKRLMKARSAGSDEFSNSATDEDLVIKISNGEIATANWPAPPVAGDIIALADGSKEWSISKVDTREDGEDVAVYFLYVVGTD